MPFGGGGFTRAPHRHGDQPMARLTKTETAQVAAVVVFAVIASLLLPRLFPFVGAAENSVGDIRLATLSPPEAQHPDIVIVTVTEDTLAALPYRSPLDRGFLAGLLRTLTAAEVRAIGLDILFDQPTEAAKDAELGDVLSNLKVPLVAAWATQEDRLTEKQTAFLEVYLKGVNKGLVNLMTDRRDAVVRWVFPGRRRGGKFIPGLPAALARALGATVPSEALPLAYRFGPDARTPPFRVFPAQTVKLLPKPWLAGKIVLIGSDLPNSDRHRTPISAFTGGGLNEMPGVFIHAHALAQILDGRRAPATAIGGEAWLLLVLAIIGVALAAIDIPVPVKIAVGLSGLAMLWVGGFALYKYAGLMIPLLSPSLAYAIGGAVGAVFLGRRERRRKRFIRHAFSRFLSPAIVKQLIDEPNRLSLGGERREVTFIFTDITAFTSLTERLDPAVLLPLLNTYLDGMCRIALDHQGTIDKIVGDAVVAFFGAPADQPNHPALAMACALEMDAFARDFSAEQQAAGIDFGHTRIGVNTGFAVVGNFGGEFFFDYTAHGDTVNTAARLESVNKHLGTTICVSGFTASRCPDTHFRPVGVLVLKGKTEGLQTFEPLSLEAAASANTAAYLEAYELMKNHDPAARQAFANLVEEYPDDKLAAYHDKRLDAGEQGMTIILEAK